MNAINRIKTSELVDGPVRKIGVQSRSITGTMPNGNRYESSLERDLMILLNFDPLVDIYTPQPLTIKYQSDDGEWHQYTPDGLIEYRKDIFVHDPRPVLVEVKYRNDFTGQFKPWLERYRAAKKYAKDRDWLFAIYTEDRIRTPFLENVKFLTPYLDRYEPDMVIWLSDKLKELQVTTPAELITVLCKDKWNQAKLIPLLWGIVARREIGCDLSEPLTMSTKIWTL
ncbi:TnsA endonuclease N-terminal domain-containing protein [Methylophilus sp. 3sh_L]|uniref:TnsA endonuclease N-terminal domain-containing protein n=1 Tax=Methylophilus sp. 3sh_L TaxID=3377114 RepID=UPI00398F0776